eukprot:CAMPEP_0176369232 /NCGR_PEP_ID=MMETSP0126-20121128/23148_1 /TAXON_ID=141414 ORGANISM="Strombidinopsis acuminatum, Strain SPMC142" /NCGR_SAMPLE_ID=MMETSP0126 /ASSEMBLY_ACC=CAM_ASM_000229 /LENGTH=40 /DNA_ID= /DNA_START= /DNA_END= /DNA_ORIENTATION=
MNSMASGLFVLEESKFYTNSALVTLAVGAIITVAGVVVIT